MSVDTRTPRTPTGGSSSGYDDQPALSTVKVPSDPAQVSGNHLSFRVQLARPPHAAARHYAGVAADTAQLPTVKGPARRRAPVVWSGRAEPGDAAPTRLLDAVRESGAARTAGGGEAGATQVLPRIGVDDAPTTVIGPRGPLEPGEPLLSGIRPTHGAFDEQPYGHGEFDVGEDGWSDEDDGEDRDSRNDGRDALLHAYYPGRRMNLGVVLLPLRVFLGLISVYAGMGKLCDPVYFDGGKRGSMVTWLTSLHPWPAAAPLRELALAHPVGAGLTVAFLQIIVGVLTIFGLWQRLAAAIGVLLSATLLVTVSWRTVPVYDAPDIIYLAAWSPLVIAGAPVYSVDGRLAGEAWRRLGPRAGIGQLRRRVLRRGTVMATVLIGLSLLVGSTLGGAVRSSRPAPAPGPSAPPVNNLPGSPLPQRPSAGSSPRGGAHGSATPGTPRPSATGRKSPSPSAKPAVPGSVKTPTGAATSGHAEAGTGGPRPATRTPHQRPAAPAAPHSPSGAATTGGSGGGGTTSGGTGTSGGSTGGGGALGGLLG
ncbi:DoxX family membrane protein [Streptomyces mobaraensis NBRC 13819 = DSM 40847]|uniref:DoxX family membrane protein n=1 Tax=Streptomyces mobaraensis TaxID=35621 RepID=A0A5N5VYQ7_STRMB|nr:DoxX family protein [Streptomyces mobaraensis]KAB7834031.1 DoxX family membrane protein [Streptomyces mobaraensis]QTT75147.1 DoxX family membrane protein [Streptomyces mobaraensis NBRC 13819 = DSM 40847]